MLKLAPARPLKCLLRCAVPLPLDHVLLQSPVSLFFGLQLCTGTDTELALLFDLFQGLVEGGQGSPVPILAACADLPLNAHYRVRALTLVGNTFATVDASDVRTIFYTSSHFFPVYIALISPNFRRPLSPWLCFALCCVELEIQPSIFLTHSHFHTPSHPSLYVLGRTHMLISHFCCVSLSIRHYCEPPCVCWRRATSGPCCKCCDAMVAACRPNCWSWFSSLY
jgi:hypothetical protein